MKKFKLIFLLSLTLLSILGTTSFANINMNEETAQNILNYCYNNINTSTNSSQLNDTNLENAKNLISKITASNFKEYFNQNFINTLNITTEITFENISFIPCYNFSNVYIDFIVSNNTYSNTLPFTYLFRGNPGLENEQTYNQFLITGTSSNSGITNSEDQNLNIIRITITSSGGLNISNISAIKKSYYTLENMEFDEDDTSINFSQLRGLSPSQVIYYSGYNTNVKKSYLLDNWYNADPNDPEIPDNPGSGDTGESGDTGGGTGGDTGGGTTTPDYSDDLENIQTGITDINNNIGNIQESIPTSGEIAGATEQANKDFWGNKDEMNEEDYENQISEGINESMEQITEELEQNEVFDSIAIAEQKIIDLFLEEPEDFKITWADIKYMDKTLVQKGEINFSQICRENETLGNVKNILNIIVSAMISLSLFKYIFNLIMVTLGIDHPLILEAEKDDITEISSTRIGNKTYVTKRTYKSDKKGGR